MRLDEACFLRLVSYTRPRYTGVRRRRMWEADSPKIATGDMDVGNESQHR